jgi:nuclear pore complex protein Nup205
MSILFSLAMNLEGAEVLYGNRIFEVLGQCQFMKAHQQDFASTNMNVDQSSELFKRYQRLLNPTLNLIAAILSVYKGQNNQVSLRVRKYCMIIYESSSTNCLFLYVFLG